MLFHIVFGASFCFALCAFQVLTQTLNSVLVRSVKLGRSLGCFTSATDKLSSCIFQGCAYVAELTLRFLASLVSELVLLRSWRSRHEIVCVQGVARACRCPAEESAARAKISLAAWLETASASLMPGERSAFCAQLTTGRSFHFMRAVHAITYQSK